MHSKSSTMTVLFLLVITCSLVSQAQTVTTAAGFDPTPVSIPEIAPGAARAITTDDLIGLRDIKGMSMSPDGKSVAYVVTQAVLETNSYRSALFVVGTEKASTPRNLGSAGPARWGTFGQFDVPPQWSPDSKQITYLLQEGGTWQIWGWKRDGGPPQQLTHNSSDVQEYRWSPDGTKIFFTTSDPPNIEEAKKKAAEGIVWDGSIVISYGRPVMRWVLEGISRKTYLWICDVAERKERRATPDEETAYKSSQAPPKGIPPNRPFKISSNGDIAYVAFVQDAKEFFTYAWSIHLKRRDERDVPLTPWNANYIQSVWWSNDGSEIYFVQRVGLRATLYSMPASGGPSRELVKSDDQFHSCSFDTQRLLAACIRENPTKTPELALLNPRDGMVRTIANVNPEFKNIKLSPATRLEWTNKYSVKTYAHLVKPLDYDPRKRYPLIVTTYRSGGFLRGAVGDEYPIQVFAANGFVVLDFDAAPLPSDSDFQTNMLRWYSPMSSFERVFEMLDQMGLVDPSRRGLTGLSYGADITEYAISHTNLFQAAVTSGTAGRDPLYYYLSGNEGAKLFATWLGGSPEGPAAPNWKELSPALNVDQVNAALLINATEREYIGALQFYTGLKEHRQPVELIIYPDEGHIKSQPKHRYLIYQRNLDWFKFWLQDKEDPDPQKREQYARWRALRNQATESK